MTKLTKQIYLRRTFLLEAFRKSPGRAFQGEELSLAWRLCFRGKPVTIDTIQRDLRDMEDAGTLQRVRTAGVDLWSLV